MKHKEAIDVLETITEFYPKFIVTKKKANMLLPLLMRMDYQGVTAKLTAYVASQPFAPTIAEIAVYPPEPNTHLEMMKLWEAEAAQVPEETKRQFKFQMERLVKELKSDESC